MWPMVLVVAESLELGHASPALKGACPVVTTPACEIPWVCRSLLLYACARMGYRL